MYEGSDYFRKNMKSPLILSILDSSACIVDVFAKSFRFISPLYAKVGMRHHRDRANCAQHACALLLYITVFDFKLLSKYFMYLDI